METLRLEVCQRSVLIDERPFVFLAEDGASIEETTTRGVVERIERHVRRRLRGKARDFGRAQILGSLRQFNSPKEGYSQFVVVEPLEVERLRTLEGRRHQVALDQAVVRAIQARLPVDHLLIERWARERGLWIGLSGKNQVLGGKARLTREGLVTDFEPSKLVARSLLDKPEAFQGGTLRVLVTDDPFVNQVTGDGAFLIRAKAPRQVSRVVTQRVRRCLDYKVQDARRGEVYLELEYAQKVARYDTEILSVKEDGDLLWIEKRERCRVDTGAKLVHELGFKGTAMVVDQWPEHIEREWPDIDAVCNASCIKSNALIYGHSQEVIWGNFQRGHLLNLPVRLLFTGEERISGKGNRISLNVLSTLHTVCPTVMERMVTARVDESPGPVIQALLWWADRLKVSGLSEAGKPEALPERSKAELKEAWGDQFERRFAFGDLADHPMLDPDHNPCGFVARGRAGNRVVVPSARALLATLGCVTVEDEPGFHFPDYVNSILQVIRSLDVSPGRFLRFLEQLRENVLRAANALRKSHSIRVPGIHGVLVAVKGLDGTVVVPDGFWPFQGTIHREPLLNRDGLRRAEVVPLATARERGFAAAGVGYLLRHLVPGDFHVLLADFDRLTLQNGDSDGDLIYLSRIPATARELGRMDAVAGAAPGFVDPAKRFEDLSRSFEKLGGDHEPYVLSPEQVHQAVMETAGSARDVGSITHWAYGVKEALAHAERWDLMAPVAKIAQAYIDGMKGTHQTSANLFAGLMRVWSRMAVPCVAARDDTGTIVAVRLAASLARELQRAGYVPGRDYHPEVEVPHPAMAEEAYRKIKEPLQGILEGILKDLERQSLATQGELWTLRGILEAQYGVFPGFKGEDRAAVVAERRATYGAVQRLYGMRPVQSRAELEAVGIRPLWGVLMALSTDPGQGREALERLADRALQHGVKPERVTF